MCLHVKRCERSGFSNTVLVTFDKNLVFFFVGTV